MAAERATIASVAQSRGTNIVTPNEQLAKTGSWGRDVTYTDGAGSASWLQPGLAPQPCNGEINNSCSLAGVIGCGDAVCLQTCCMGFETLLNLRFPALGLQHLRRSIGDHPAMCISGALNKVEGRMRKSDAILKAYHRALAGRIPLNVTRAGEFSGCKGGVPTDEYIARPAWLHFGPWNKIRWK